MDPDFVARQIKERLLEDLEKLEKRNVEALVRFRKKKIRAVGHYSEGLV
jgi:acetyl-CoA carboxylase alpha subunit